MFFEPFGQGKSCCLSPGFTHATLTVAAGTEMSLLKYVVVTNLGASSKRRPARLRTRRLRSSSIRRFANVHMHLASERARARASEAESAMCSSVNIDQYSWELRMQRGRRAAAPVDDLSLFSFHRQVFLSIACPCRAQGTWREFKVPPTHGHLSSGQRIRARYVVLIFTHTRVS